MGGITPEMLASLFPQGMQQRGQQTQPEQMSQQGQFNPANVQAQLSGGPPPPFSFAPGQGGVGNQILNALAQAGKAATYVAESPQEREAEQNRAQRLWETKQKMGLAAQEFGQKEKDRAQQSAIAQGQFAQQEKDRAATRDIAQKGLDLKGQELQETIRNHKAIESMKDDPADKVIHAYVDQQDFQHVIFQRQDSSTYDKKFDTSKVKPPANTAAEGTWSLQQDDQGRPILFNSKTAQTKPAPGGMVPKGTGQLTPATQGILQSTSPVKDQVQQLQQALDDYVAENPKHANDRLTLSRLGYSLGMPSKEGDIAEQISKLELDRVMSGARVLKGSSRAYQALELAMKHAPNPWIDTVQLMRQKLGNIRQNLEDVERDAVQYGTKGQRASDVTGATQPSTSGKEIHYKIINGQLVPQ